MAVSQTLRRGDRGSDVKELQHALQTQGFGPLSLDGIFGSGTETCVVRAQKAHGLAADGIAGPHTLTALGIYEDEDEPPSPWTAGIESIWTRFAAVIDDERMEPEEMEAEAALATMAVESNGQGTVVLDGVTYPIIRFETHLFERWTTQARFDEHFRQNPSKGWLDQQYRVSTSDTHSRFP